MRAFAWSESAPDCTSSSSSSDKEKKVNKLRTAGKMATTAELIITYIRAPRLRSWAVNMVFVGTILDRNTLCRHGVFAYIQKRFFEK